MINFLKYNIYFIKKFDYYNIKIAKIILTKLTFY